jgi:hypothetical protein
VALKSDAAAEKPKDQLSRDFLGCSIFDFCNSICQEATSDEIAANVFLLDLSQRLGNIQYSFSNNRGLGQLGPLRASRGVRTRFTLRRHHGTTHPSACDAGKPSAASITQFHLVWSLCHNSPQQGAAMAALHRVGRTKIWPG